MNLYATPYQLLTAGNTGNSGNPVQPPNTVIAAGEYSEALPFGQAKQIDLSIVFTAGATGTVRTQQSPTKDFANFAEVDTNTLPTTGTVATFNYPGTPSSAFLRILNNSNQSITVYAQITVGN